ncbi:hypothetical protein OHB26_23330 [Nocardia sp. NBC_01503]|uniref:hypothetical protein n=1 Tax=Nocardia sp. NBC_01503 TaxID=2975997 RepID=UPI002E7ABCCF|nr:hypothetical protein [Nocardia sp. NBC_01503]WTL29890.1 hypothetical protein OHB26_23330 [Nocardia sp. NBC_01503]
MPDTNAMKTHQPPYPEKYWVAPVLEQGYRTLPKTFSTTFDGFGAGPTTQPPAKTAPSKIEPFGLSGMASAGITNYQALATSLNNSFSDLQAANALVAPAVEDTALTAMKAQQNINTLIMGMAEDASKVPPEPMTENEWVMELITKVTENLATVVSNAKGEMQRAKADIDGAAKTIKDQKDLIAKLQAEAAKRAGDAPPPAGWPAPNGGLNNGQVYQPPNLGLGPLNPGGTGRIPGGVTPTPDPTLPPKPDGTTPPDTSRDDPSRDIPDIGRQPDNTPPTPQQPQYPNMATPSTMGGMGGGMDPMSMMLPSLLSAMQPNMNDRLQADPNRYDREDPYDRYPQNAVPVQASPAAVTPQAPASTPPATTTTPPATTDKPAGPAQPAAPATTVAPGSDGGVDYPFPDGITQRVSVVVAKALDKAFGNKSGTDAQTAYADTTAKLDIKQPDQRVDPGALMTGDVGIWENPDMVAIVRAMGSGAEERLDLIVNGELRRYPDQISETTGDLGQLVGWAHPRGIEMTGTSAKYTDGAAPGTGDPAASLPVVAAPAS